MQSFFEILQANPYILLFTTIGLAVLLGNICIKGYVVGMVAAAVIVGCALAAWASSHGVKLRLDDFAKWLFYYLFVYGFGLRVGPSIIKCLKKDGLKFTLLASICSVIGLILVVFGAKSFGLPFGTAGGILAGSQTMAAALGTAEVAVIGGAYKTPLGSTAESVSAMIALGCAVSCIWGAIGMTLICKYLPHWWRVDVKRAAKEYEKAQGVTNVNKSDLTGYRPGGLRAFVLENSFAIGHSIAHFREKHPQYRIVNLVRAGSTVELSPEELLQAGDIIALAGEMEHLTANLGSIGPEVADAQALNIPIDQAEIVVTDKSFEGRALKSFRSENFAGQLQVIRLERGGVPIPLGADTELQRHDVLFVAGLKSAVHGFTELIGKVARPSTAIDLFVLSAGMVAGLLIGQIGVPIGGHSVGVGTVGGLLLSGILVSWIVSRVRFFGKTPNAARNFLEDLGLVAFVAILGINAGPMLFAQLTGKIALFIFVAGFIASTIPPIITWAIGYHLFKINPAVLIGVLAGARSHSGSAREASSKMDSSVPWVGFPVANAVSGILLLAFGYLAMRYSK